MTKAELKAMGVRVRATVEVFSGAVWINEDNGHRWVHVADFPTRAKAEQYARDLRRAMRGE